VSEAYYPAHCTACGACYPALLPNSVRGLVLAHQQCKHQHQTIADSNQPPFLSLSLPLSRARALSAHWLVPSRTHTHTHTHTHTGTTLCWEAVRMFAHRNDTTQQQGCQLRIDHMVQVRCAFFDRTLHSRMTLVPVPAPLEALAGV
jgi:hypothetical protein